MPQVDILDVDITEGKVFISCHMNTNLKSNSWIIDSGASSHITHSSNFFHEFTPLTNDFFTLPDHSKVQAHAIGTVILLDFLTQCGLYSSISCKFVICLSLVAFIYMFSSIF